MGTDNIAQIISLVILLVLSAFFSSAETALTTVNKIRMRTLSDSGNRNADRVLRVTEDSAKMLSAILIGNNIVNLSASSIATTLAIDIFGSVGAGIATGILTLLILIFGEVSPKTMATIYADKLSLKIAGIIELLMKILTPVIFIVNKLSMGFLFILGVDPNYQSNAMTEEELRTIVDAFLPAFQTFWVSVTLSWFLFPGCFPHPLCLEMPTLPGRFSWNIYHLLYETLSDHRPLPFPGKNQSCISFCSFMPSSLYHLNMCFNVYIIVLHVNSRS